MYPEIAVGFSVNIEHSMHYAEDARRTKHLGNHWAGVSGSSWNIAQMLHLLGHKVNFFGLIGADEGSLNDYILCSSMQSSGIPVTLLRGREKTPVTTILIPQGGKIVNVRDKKPARDRILAAHIEEKIAESRPRCRIISGLLADEDAQAEIDFAEAFFDAHPESREKRVLVLSFELARFPELAKRLLGKTDVLIGNDLEFKSLLNKESVEPDSLRQFHDCWGIETVVETQNSHGAIFSSAAGQVFRQPAIVCGDFVDGTGAGDCFTAAFVSCLLKKKTAEEAMRYAATAAGLTVSNHGGAAQPTANEIELVLSAKGMI